jgi:type IV secretion system protein VirB1
MIYDGAAIMMLASQCAPSVAPQTVAAIVRTESRGHQFALNVNGGKQPTAQSNATDAAATARRYINAGYSVDLGLGQINSRNLRGLGLTLETIFEPCTNIAALGTILSANYKSVRPGRDPQEALRMALSMYNTGSSSRGFANGYVGKVVVSAGFTPDFAPAPLNIIAPEQATSGPDSRAQDLRDTIISENQPAPPAKAVALEPPPPRWNVFEYAAYERRAREIENNQKGSEL